MTEVLSFHFKKTPVYFDILIFLINGSAFSMTWFPPELRRVLSCELPAVFLHFPLEEKGPWALLSAMPGTSKRETPTSNTYIHTYVLY